ncbi:MAG: phosphoenolpyruvate--protein phosphotransferase [Planctomycetes bacterium]|nr:phosphoenolpyruvate--protein phosphotransferase [Planctomycetota bacterium]
MNLLHRLSLVVQRSHSLAAILDSTVEIIAEEMEMDVCSIYLLDPADWQLRLMATHGLEKSAVGKVRLGMGKGLTGTVVAEMRSLAVEDASSHPGYLYFPETREERYKSYLGVPMAIRNRPVGAIVVQTMERRAYSQQDIETLASIAAQLVGIVENARIIEALDRGEEGGRYLQEIRSWHAGERARGVEADARVNVQLSGGAASGGIAMGEVALRGDRERGIEPKDAPFQGAEEETRRVRDALQRTQSDIVKIQKDAEREIDEEHALIFSSYLLLLNDEVLLERIERSIESGVTAPIAVFGALEEFKNQLAKVADSYIRDRIEDILDLRGRILAHLLEEKPVSSEVTDRIVVARRTPPSLIIELKAEGGRALVTEVGGVTSHGALLARSMGIPAVTGVQGITSIVRGGDRLIVDGSSGTVVVNPTVETLERYERKARRSDRRHQETLAYCNLPARTADGKRLTLLANIGVAADLGLAKKNGAQGVGLYRTEFSFILREYFPTREEQVRIYRKAYETFPEGPIHFRLLDLGGDKFLPQGTLDASRDPFHGYRSIRVLRDHPEVLRDQVQAFALAAAGRPLSILIPMVSSLEELQEIRAMIDDAIGQLPDRRGRQSPQIGAMIELPAAVEIAGSLAEESDCLSIGTNDLIQYALAVDRESSRLAGTRDPYHPAVLRMIRRTVLLAREQGKPVSVCGEMASRWRLALLLFAMGVDSLSVTPGALPELKQRLATHELGPLESRIDDVLALPGASQIREDISRMYPETNRD